MRIVFSSTMLALDVVAQLSPDAAALSQGFGGGLLLALSVCSTVPAALVIADRLVFPGRETV